MLAILFYLHFNVSLSFMPNIFSYGDLTEIFLNQIWYRTYIHTVLSINDKAELSIHKSGDFPGTLDLQGPQKQQRISK